MRTTLLGIGLTGLLAALLITVLPLDAAEPGADDKLVTMVYPVANIPTHHLGSSEFKPTLLSAYLKAAVDPESWGRGSIQKHGKTMSLVIKQTRANQRRIADLLTDLRRPREEVEENVDLFPPSR